MSIFSALQRRSLVIFLGVLHNELLLELFFHHPKDFEGGCSQPASCLSGVAASSGPWSPKRLNH